MQAPVTLSNELARLDSLRRMLLLETPDEEVFDRLTRIAKNLFDVPIALVSLIDENRQWFKSCIGLPVRETPRSISFCGHAILTDELFVIPDARDDVRFADNPLVTDAPFIRFYAGYPLKNAEGFNVGTLCIISPEPRYLNDEALDLLRDMGSCVETAFQVRELSDTQRLLLEELDYVKHQALVSPLLRIWNKKGISDILNKELSALKRKSGEFAAIAIIVDQYKTISTTVGKLAADEFLSKIVRKIKQHIPTKGFSLGHYDEDKLVIIAPNTSLTSLTELASRMRDDVIKAPAESLVTHSDALKATLTIGMSFVDTRTYTGTFTGDELLSAADQAVYLAKQGGDGQQEVIVF